MIEPNMTTAVPPREPLLFTPIYKVVVWGGRRMAAWRSDLPEGPVGESWDLSCHPNGRSVVAHGTYRGLGLDDLVTRFGPQVVGDSFSGGSFPLMVKLIDAAERLSVQVHPDDEGAMRLGLGFKGKSECWLFLQDNAEVFVGTRVGVDRSGFESARVAGQLESVLNVFTARAGDFFFIPARTVHALGRGCLVYEIQQTSDITFRVDDWGRMGIDGHPRLLHVPQSLDTIDFSQTGFNPNHPAWQPDGVDGEKRLLIDAVPFAVEERRGAVVTAPLEGSCAVLTCLQGQGDLQTPYGKVRISQMQTALIPALGEAWKVTADHGSIRLLVAKPR